jgi:succinate-semialdehyde dehydrogenase/glutarate-semialdehyde dehydrogenase
MNRETTECINPATGQLLGRSPLNTPEDVRLAVLNARAAQDRWAGVSVRTRARAIRRVRSYLVEHVDELAETISHDNGKVRFDALATEVLPAALAAGYYASRARRFLKTRRLWPGHLLFANKSSQIRRVPWGVVAIISPWNYPFAIPFSEIVMALLAGNGVILKVASQTQIVGRALQRAFAAAELPKGLFSYVNLPGRTAGDALLDAHIDKLFFTGSVAAGKELMAKAAKTLTPVSLELGGNDPMVVCPDAHLERAAAGALWAGYSNAGQSCGGVERIYVHADIYHAFVDKLAEKVRTLRIGPDNDHHVDMGAMTTTAQMETVRRHIDDAVRRGAAVFAQADPPSAGQGNFLPAVLLTNVNHSMAVMKEETFGPVVAVMKVDDMDAAVRLANDSDLGLTASVWSRNRRHAMKLARQLQAGVVTINDHLMSHGLPETPWGGLKLSGIGRTHGSIGFDEMTQPQCIVGDLFDGLPKNLWWHPYDAELYDGIRGLLTGLYGKGIGTRLSGLRATLKIATRLFQC